MLFCDLCDRGFHMECCDPPLSKAPKGDVSVFYRSSSLYLYPMHTNLGNYISNHQNFSLFGHNLYKRTYDNFDNVTS